MARILEKVKALKRTPKQEMTYEEFLDWGDEDTYAEWVEMMSPASRKHQNLAFYLASLLTEFEERGAGEVYTSPESVLRDRGQNTRNMRRAGCASTGSLTPRQNARTFLS